MQHFVENTNKLRIEDIRKRALTSKPKNQEIESKRGSSNWSKLWNPYKLNQFQYTVSKKSLAVTMTTQQEKETVLTYQC